MRHVILLARDHNKKLHVVAEGNSIETLRQITETPEFNQQYESWLITKNPAVELRGVTVKPAPVAPAPETAPVAPAAPAPTAPVAPKRTRAPKVEQAPVAPTT